MTNDNNIQFIHANGVELAYLEKGSGPLVICLHGFPDTAYSFTGLLDVLAANGYHAVAPFLRGYYPSGLAPDNNYSIPAVAGDVLALIDALGDGQASVIGHDWGGFAAYTAANISPEKIPKLVVMCVPHMHCPSFSFSQLKKSWYVMLFQLPWLPERMVAKNNFAFIDRLYRTWSPGWGESEFNLQPVKVSLAAEGGLAAALGYYRAMIRGAKAQHRQIMSQQTSVPALWIAGEDDGCIDLRQYNGMDVAFSDHFELFKVAGAGHFVHREAPELVQNKILSLLAS